MCVYLSVVSLSLSWASVCLSLSVSLSLYSFAPFWCRSEYICVLQIIFVSIGLCVSVPLPLCSSLSLCLDCLLSCSSSATMYLLLHRIDVPKDAPHVLVWCHSITIHPVVIIIHVQTPSSLSVHPSRYPSLSLFLLFFLISNCSPPSFSCVS